MGILRVLQMVSGVVLGLATCIGMSGQTAATTKGEAMPMSIQEVHVQRVNLATSEPLTRWLPESTHRSVILI